MAARVHSRSSGHLPRPLNTSPFASARVFPCSCVMFAANASCIIQSLENSNLFAAVVRHEATRPDHVFSDQLLELEHDTLSVRNWSAFPSRESIFGCLHSLLKLTICDNWHPRDNFLRGLHAYHSSACFQKLMRLLPSSDTHGVLHIQPLACSRVLELPIDQHFGCALQGQVVN